MTEGRIDIGLWERLADSWVVVATTAEARASTRQRARDAFQQDSRTLKKMNTAANVPSLMDDWLSEMGGND